MTEAGGHVTDIRGREATFTHGSTMAKNEGMVVSNGCQHAHVIAAILKNAPPEMS